MNKEKIYKKQTEVIDQLIDQLKDLKTKVDTFELIVTPDMVDEMRLVDGSMYAKRSIHIDIVYNQLWTKNENDFLDTWKPYKQEETKECQ